MATQNFDRFDLMTITINSYYENAIPDAEYVDGDLTYPQSSIDYAVDYAKRQLALMYPGATIDVTMERGGLYGGRHGAYYDVDMDDNRDRAERNRAEADNIANELIPSLLTEGLERADLGLAPEFPNEKCIATPPMLEALKVGQLFYVPVAGPDCKGKEHFKAPEYIKMRCTSVRWEDVEFSRTFFYYADSEDGKKYFVAYHGTSDWVVGTDDEPSVFLGMARRVYRVAF